MDAKAQYIDIRWIIEVSIHAPVMDAKLLSIVLIDARLCFNPRARDGREILILILIHRL